VTTAGATASDSPYIKGRNARLYGKSRESCPYPEGSQDREGWLEAFDAASVPEAEIDLGTIDDVAVTKS
jgi:ribosome modulation factor